MRTRVEIERMFAEREALSKAYKVFLVGIGGAGMSSLARLTQSAGRIVQGSDVSASMVTAELEAQGIQVRIGHQASLPADVDAVVVSDAIDLTTCPEVAAARAQNIPLFRRSQLLGWLLKGRKVAAVTGTHGKTTTTGLLAAGMIAAGLDPLVIVGATVPQFGGAIVEGRGEWAVIEACEAYDALIDIDPDLVLLTNLELDHADFHGTYQNLEASVLDFCKKLPDECPLVYCVADAGAKELASKFEGVSQGYDLRQGLALQLPGDHNAWNGSGAVAALEAILGRPATQRELEAIEAYTGAERRLQVIEDGEFTIIDDYAHHPTEVEASLKAVRARYQNRRLVTVFQPHLYSRTQAFMEGFAASLSLSDLVVLTDIYPAREEPIPGISSAVLAERISVPVHYIPSRHLLAMKVAQLLQPGDVVVSMGAGTISELAPRLVAELESKKSKSNSRAPRVMIAFGGDSSEREVSIHSGREIFAAVQRLGYEAKLTDLSEILLSTGNLSALLGPARPDLVMLAVHGTHAEDGAIQGLLELLHIAFTGSGIQASALAMDKQKTKEILASKGISVPQGLVVTETVSSAPFGLPWVVKPNAEGSTVGVSFVHSLTELAPALAKAFKFGKDVLIEEMIVGVELSTPILIDQPLPVVEIAPNSGVYDFESKYRPGATNEIVPARISNASTAECQRIAMLAHNTLGCKGATRTDMILRNEEIFVLEVNTLPGMTRTSLLPNSAAAAGISFDDLCDRLIRDGLSRAGQNELMRVQTGLTSGAST